RSVTVKAELIGRRGADSPAVSKGLIKHFDGNYGHHLFTEPFIGDPDVIQQCLFPKRKCSSSSRLFNGRTTNFWRELQQQRQEPDHRDSAPNDGQPSIHRVSVKLPPFWPDRPNIWFAPSHSQFAISGITSDVTKFHHVVSQLDARYALEVEDNIINPPAEDPYQQLRRELIRRLSASEEQRVRQLIGEEDIGDRKPSQFLRHLRSLAGTTAIQDSILRQLWMRRLPANTQAILAAQSDLSMDKLAELADKIVEISLPPQQAVYATTAAPPLEEFLQKIEALSAQVAALSSRGPPNNRRARSRSRGPSSNRARPNKPPAHTGWCWYHSTFKDRARKCEAPCTFAKCKDSLADAALLVHPKTDARLGLFRHFLEEQHCTIFTDHKPLIHAFKQRREKLSPTHLRQLSFISVFTTDIQHVSGADNVVLYALSRPNEVEAISNPVNYGTLAEEQDMDTELADLLKNNSLQKRPVPGTPVTLYCDISTDKPRPYIPRKIRCQVFERLHSLHSSLYVGQGATQHLVPHRNCSHRDFSGLVCRRTAVHGSVGASVLN
ncbi:hypothetical protein J437_LFUL000995, partial [Ladona fulva]